MKKRFHLPIPASFFGKSIQCWLVVLAVAGALGYGVWHGFLWWNAPLAIEQTASLRVAPGDTMGRVAQRLAAAGVLHRPRLLRWMTRLTGQAGSVQVGEYALQPGDTPRQLVARMVRGEVLHYDFRIAEGIRIAALLAALGRQDKLRQTLGDAAPETLLADLRIAPPDEALRHGEGWFFPDTYRFVAGDSDRSLLLRAHEKMREELAAAWAGHAADLPYQTPYELLIAASIVEKETGREADRAHVSQVLAARLRKGMRLQADPTVIYGLGDAFDGNLTRAHLKQPGPYNSYLHRGLPPTPIALPGRAALRAAAQPSGAPYLYFVARGDGSSQFSATLAEHLAAVRQYQLGK